MPREIPQPMPVQGKAHQLALPFVASDLPAPAIHTTVVETIPPPSLWPSLSATARTRVRQQILHVAREVLRDGQRSG
jgi:hypothetical protein